MRMLAGVVLLVLAVSVSGEPARPASAVHYLVVHADTQDELSILSERIVEISGELAQDDHEEDLQPGRGRERYFVTVRDADGRKVWQTRVDAPRYRHSEWGGADGVITGRWIPLDEITFVLRVPAETGTTLEIRSQRSKKTATFPLADLARNSALHEPRFEEVVSSSLTGSPANRLDILIIGDGYTSAQVSKFNVDTAAMIDDFFNATPYSEYRNYVNITTYFVASAQSGADHPACSDPYKEADPLEGTLRSTALDATYCTAGIQRLLTVNESKALAAAASVPDWDKLFVIVNDPMYGGAGGPVAVASTNEFAVLVAQHEFGHSFTGLGDEYDTPYPGFPSCSDAGSNKCEPNVTDRTSRAAVKWNPWILAATPVPTPATESYFDVVGLFQGARYSPTQYYKPQAFCGMNGLGAPFCAICTQEYVLRLYRGWSGVPANGIDMIEPGSENPAHTSTVAAAVGTPATFSASILEPVGGPAAKREWLVDGVLLAGQTASSLTHTFSSTGAHTVRLRVTDQTTFVHPTMALAGIVNSLQRTRLWNVQVAAGAPSGFSATGGSAQVALSWNPVSGASSYQIARSLTGPAGFTTLATTATTSYDDASVIAGNGYLYRVHAVTGGTPGPGSAPDLATVFAFTDDTLAAGSTIRSIHFTQLRTAIDAARAAAGLGAFSYSSLPGVGEAAAGHMNELRQAANQARTAISLSAFTFIDDPVSAGTPVRATHVNQLRTSIR